MYKCVCGYKSSMKSSMLSHLNSCNKAKRAKAGIYGDTDILDDMISTGLTLSLFDSCCDIIPDSSSDFSGFGGGDFGGGGASGGWDD